LSYHRGGNRSGENMRAMLAGVAVAAVATGAALAASKLTP
jgi:hypothetical protein